MIRLDAYKNKNVGVFGLGIAGKAAIQSLLSGGAHVCAWDDNDNSRAALEQDAALMKNPHFSLKPVEAWKWAGMEGIVLSPGVPLTHPEPHRVVKMANNAKLRILGEVDLLYQACPYAKYIGITGTNGKSTTTGLIGHILKHVGKDVQIGANFGTPSLALRPVEEDGWYVLEMSSYQLDLVKQVVFNASVLMNITPDHLDRHGGMEGYVAAKRKIFERQRDKDACIIGLDDGYCRDMYIELVREHRPNIIPFSVTQRSGKGVEVDNDGIMHADGQAFDLKMVERLKGRHNWQNIAAAYATLRNFGVAPEMIMEAAQSFPGLPHRLEHVMTLKAISFYNDSKGTNADATAKALEPFDHIYWILGGKAKADGIDTLTEYFPKIAHAFLIGEAQDVFARTLEGKVAYTKCGDLENATRKAAEMVFADHASGGTVVFSPACASFDQWKNYEARGDAFRQYVRDIAAKGGA